MHSVSLNSGLTLRAQLRCLFDMAPDTSECAVELWPGYHCSLSEGRHSLHYGGAKYLPVKWCWINSANTNCHGHNIRNLHLPWWIERNTPGPNPSSTSRCCLPSVTRDLKWSQFHGEPQPQPQPLPERVTTRSRNFPSLRSLWLAKSGCAWKCGRNQGTAGNFILAWLHRVKL